ncbi:MAG: 1-phosphofructokinase family hexose kinase [Armatimonadota bacterium]
MITVLCANAGVDKTYEVPNFAVGGFYHPSAASTVAGGKGINVARVLAALNQVNTVLGFAGGNNGRFIAADLMEADLKTDLVNIAEESRVTINIIDRTQHTQTRVDEIGPLVTPTEVRRLRDRWTRNLRGSAMGIIAGSAPRGINLELYAELVEIARSMKKPVFLDAHDELLARAVPAGPTVVTPNLSELQRLVGRQLTVPEGIIATGTELLEDGIRVVLVTLGARGAIGVTRSSGIWWARPPKVDRISSVGCGDAFVAGFAVGSMQRRPFEQRLRLAAACGAANAETFGACNVTAARVAELEADVTLDRLDGEGTQEDRAPSSN